MADDVPVQSGCQESVSDEPVNVVRVTVNADYQISIFPLVAFSGDKDIGWSFDPTISSACRRHEDVRKSWDFADIELHQPIDRNHLPSSNPNGPS